MTVLRTGNRFKDCDFRLQFASPDTVGDIRHSGTRQGHPSPRLQKPLAEPTIKTSLTFIDRRVIPSSGWQHRGMVPGLRRAPFEGIGKPPGGWRLISADNDLQFRLCSLASLTPHEHYNEQEARAIADDIIRNGEVRDPLLIDLRRKIILDGHHRFAALKDILKLRQAPCYLIDYDGPDISVYSWREDVAVTKSDVIAAASSRKLLPEKTSRHELRLETRSRPTLLSLLR